MFFVVAVFSITFACFAVVVVAVDVVVVVVVVGGLCGAGQFNSATGCTAVPTGELRGLRTDRSFNYMGVACDLLS